MKSISFRCVYLLREVELIHEVECGVLFFPVYGVFVRFFCQVAFDQRGYVEEELMVPRLRTREFRKTSTISNVGQKIEIRNTM